MKESNAPRPETHSLAESSTAGNMDTERLLEVVSHLCYEHLAMQTLLEELHRLRWKKDVLDLALSDGFAGVYRTEFDVMRETLQASHDVHAVIPRLTVVLNELLVRRVLP